jgi:hypothetical protein
MVSQKDIQGLDFENIGQYFEYCIDSITNGNRTQARELIKKMSSSQKKAFLKELNDYGQSECVREAKHLTIELL